MGQIADLCSRCQMRTKRPGQRWCRKCHAEEERIARRLGARKNPRRKNRG